MDMVSKLLKMVIHTMATTLIINFKVMALIVGNQAQYTLVNLLMARDKGMEFGKQIKMEVGIHTRENIIKI